MKHYSTIKKEILLLVTKFFDFEGVILNERSQKKTNTLALLLCVEVVSFFCFFLRMIQTCGKRPDVLLPDGRAWKESELNEGGQNVQNSSYKINKY